MAGGGYLPNSFGLEQVADFFGAVAGFQVDQMARGSV